MNTAPPRRHEHHPISHKKPRLHFTVGNNLLASFNQTDRFFFNTDEASTSNAPFNSLREATNVTTSSHYSDDGNSDSEDDLNLCNSSYDEEELHYEPLVDSHLEGT